MTYFLSQDEYDQLQVIYDEAKASGSNFNQVYERIGTFIETPDPLGNTVDGNVSVVRVFGTNGSVN